VWQPAPKKSHVSTAMTRRGNDNKNLHIKNENIC